MNPFLQDHWGDVHTALLGFIREALSEELPGDLSVRAEQHVVMAGQDGFSPLWSRAPAEPGELTVAEPLVFVDDPDPERWVEIRTGGGELITVLEVLSPANKHLQGAEDYRARQRRFLAAGVNLVEIDLLRGGEHVVTIGRERLSLPPGTCHLVCVARPRPGERWRREVYPCPLREPLPTIRVPLRITDPDVPLALQALVDRCYRTGRYWLADTSRPLQPVVGEEEAAWVRERLQAAGG